MASKEQTFVISCEGGLDETSTTRDLLKKPGWGTVLLNFEASSDGGYRRINGYSRIGETGKLPGASNLPIDGMTIYNDGFVIAQGREVYYTKDQLVYLQLNRTGAETSALNYNQFQLLALKPREIKGHYNFVEFTQGLKKTLIGVRENDVPFYVEIEGELIEDTTFKYKDLTLVSGSLKGANHCVKYKDQLVISGMETNPSVIYYSDILAPDNFEGGNAGFIGFNDRVTGLKMFREVLYVFCANSIHRVRGLETGSPIREPVTQQLGCIDGNSIQEIAGDLVFLGPDGLRTLSATQRIDDIELSTMSKVIYGRLRRANQQISFYNIRSTVIRNKSQYRLFFVPKDPTLSIKPLAFSMYMGLVTEQGILPQFTELQGFDIQAIYSGYKEVTETIISGDYTGNIFYHDTSSQFDGQEINYILETPYFDLGDHSIRKAIYKIHTYIKNEGSADFRLQLKFDYDIASAYQPPPYPMNLGLQIATYDTTLYNTNTYGKRKYPVIPSLTEGSGKAVAIRLFPSGLKCDPFSVHGFDVTFVPFGKL